MGSTFLSLHYHLVFSTKNREEFIEESWPNAFTNTLAARFVVSADNQRELAAWQITCICWSACEPLFAWPT